MPPVRSRARQLARAGLVAAGVALCLLFSLFLLPFSFPPSHGAGATVTAGAQASPIAPRDFVRIVRVTGTTEATRSALITAPSLAGSAGGQLVITKIAPPGAAVKAGDVIVEFDRQQQETAAFDKRAEYNDLIEQIAKTRAAQAAARVKDESELEQAVNAVTSLELESLKNEMLSRIDAQANEQKLEAARVRERALRGNLPRKREAAAAELHILEIRRDRARLAMEDAERNARAMVIRSPIDGLVVAKMTWKGNGPGDVAEGDQLWSGAPIMEVVNVDAMRVRAKVNQGDIAHIRVGQPVTVRLDAYDDFTLPGRVEHVAPLAMPGSFSPRVRAFAMLVSVEGTNERLMPDLTAAVDVEVERVEDAIVVPREAVRMENGAAHVRVRSGSGTETRRVTLGSRNEIEVVVSSGLKAGDVVVR